MQCEIELLTIWTDEQKNILREYRRISIDTNNKYKRKKFLDFTETRNSLPSSFWKSESFTEQSELSEFVLAKSKSGVIALQSYRTRSQLQKASLQQINCIGSWDPGCFLGMFFPSTAMREVRDFLKKSGYRRYSEFSRYSRTLLRYQINLSYSKLVFGHVFEIPHAESMWVKSDLIKFGVRS